MSNALSAMSSVGLVSTGPELSPAPVLLVAHTWFPYHQPLLEKVQQLLGRPIEWFVLSASDRNRAWALQEAPMRPVVVPGFRVFVGFRELNINHGFRKLLAGMDPGVVVTKGWGDPGYGMAQALARQRKIPLITWACARDSRTRNSWASRCLRRASNLVARRVLRNSRFVFCYGSRARKDVLALGAREKDVIVVKQSIDEQRFDYARHRMAPEQRLKLRRRFGLDEGPLFLCVSQLIPRKGIHDLLQAFAAVRAERREAQLLLIGKGSLAPLVEQFAREHAGHFAWLPQVPYEDIPAYYQLSDCFLFPTHFDAWGVVINEAHCGRLPIICSNTAYGSEDLIVDGHSGLLYSAGDVQALRERMLWALDNPAEMERMAQNGYDFVQTSWNHQQSAHIWAENLKIAMAERVGPLAS
jgi:glycosyltransferase involved in cell wall biosynthesis